MTDADRNNSLERTFRSAPFWFGVIFVCYCASFLWLGELVLNVPIVAFVAPSGLFHLFGVPGFDDGLGVLDRMSGTMPLILPGLILVHAVFWWMFATLIYQRKCLRRDHLLKVGWCILAALLANLVGCATMTYRF